jgi:hypothetical protein
MRPPKAAICAAAVACLAVFTGASAQAAVFDFSFGPGVIGTFTTGAAAADPGFDLITGLTFGLLSGTDLSGVHFSFANEVASDFAAGAAFDPTTAAFINHSEGSTFDDIGGFGLPDAEISGISFSQHSTSLEGNLELAPFAVHGPLEIAEEVGAVPAPVPEPSTWAMMLIGFAGLGFAGYKRAWTRSRPGSRVTGTTLSRPTPVAGMTRRPGAIPPESALR